VALVRRSVLLYALSAAAPLQAFAQQPPDVQAAPALWRNYRRVHATFAADSATCIERERSVRGPTGSPAESGIDGSCMVEDGWIPMRVLPSPPACAPVVLHPSPADSAANAAFFAELTTTLERLFRPPSPGDTAATIVMNVESSDIHARMPGIYDESLPHAIRLAVSVTKTELPAFANHLPPGTTAEVVARFEPKCVAEFPALAVAPPPPAYFEFQVEQVVRPTNRPTPQYPPSLESAGYEGRVLAQFVVDTLGRVDVRTFKVLESPHPLFSKAVQDALPSMRYKPAMIKGRKVRQIVQQPFTFAIRE
jgi:TonB family protein